MESPKIAIVCDGKGIKYGINLFHLFHYKNEDGVEFNSGKFAESQVEMYSLAVMRHSNFSEDAIKIYIGAAKLPDASYRTVFNQLGMTVCQRENEYILMADDKKMNSYIEFISFANKKRMEYIGLETEYYRMVNKLDENWIAGEFIQELECGLFGKKDMMLRKMYDGLAFVVYLDVLR